VINYQDEIQLQKITSCNHNHVTSLDSAGPAFNHTSRTVNHHKKLRNKSNRKINNYPIRRHTKRTKVDNNNISLSISPTISGGTDLRKLLAKANYNEHSEDISDNNDCYDNYDNEQDEEEPVEKKKAVINYQDEIQLQKITSCNHNHVTSLDSAGPAFNHTSRTVNHHKKLRDKSNRKINNHPIRRHTKRTKVGNNKRTDFVPDKVESGFEILKKLLSTTTNARHGDTKNNKKKKRKNNSKMNMIIMKTKKNDDKRNQKERRSGLRQIESSEIDARLCYSEEMDDLCNSGMTCGTKRRLLQNRTSYDKRNNAKNEYDAKDMEKNIVDQSIDFEILAMNAKVKQLKNKRYSDNSIRTLSVDDRQAKIHQDKSYRNVSSKLSNASSIEIERFFSKDAGVGCTALQKLLITANNPIRCPEMKKKF